MENLSQFESQYITLRALEGRIYSNEEVKLLPIVSDNHPLKEEWKIRQRSSDRLINYLKNTKRPLRILEIGCGNGWLSASLSSIPESTVVGTDINSFELNQAKSVFNEKNNLKFELDELSNPSFLSDQYFSIIVFAASIQYFSSFHKTINLAFGKLDSGGEIHILDTHFYHENDLNRARKQSEIYFKSMGVSAMEPFYHHHCIKDLMAFRHSFKYKPFRLLNKILNRNDPFSWVCVYK